MVEKKVREYTLAELEKWVRIITRNSVSLFPVRTDPKSIDDSLRVTKSALILGCFAQSTHMPAGRSPVLGVYGGLMRQRGVNGVFLVSFQNYASFGEKRFPNLEIQTHAWEYSARVDSLSKLYKVS